MWGLNSQEKRQSQVKGLEVVFFYVTRVTKTSPQIEDLSGIKKKEYLTCLKKLIAIFNPT